MEASTNAPKREHQPNRKQPRIHGPITNDKQLLIVRPSDCQCQFIKNCRQLQIYIEILEEIVNEVLFYHRRAQKCYFLLKVGQNDYNYLRKTHSYKQIIILDKVSTTVNQNSISAQVLFFFWLRSNWYITLYQFEVYNIIIRSLYTLQ